MSVDIESLEYWDEVKTPSLQDRLYELYHENSKYGKFDSQNRATSEDVERYTSALHEVLEYHYSEKIELPKPAGLSGQSLRAAIEDRVSCRAFKNQAMTVEQVSALLQLSYGIRADTKYGRCLRVCPSAGALYPLELYFYSGNIEGMGQGLWHYNPVDHFAGMMEPGDLSDRIDPGMIDKEALKNAPFVLFATAIFERSTLKYGERGYRFALMETGHLMQNLNLVAIGLGLATLNVGGFYDRQVNKLLDIDGVNHAALYISAVGHSQIIEDQDHE